MNMAVVGNSHHGAAIHDDVEKNKEKRYAE
jgi:hypothetical protein